MISQEDQAADPPPCSPRISFSADFLDDAEFISISPNSSLDKEIVARAAAAAAATDHHQHGFLKSPDFEFLSAGKSSPSQTGMLTADQLFFQGKFLPFRQLQNNATPSDRLGKVTTKEDPPALATMDTPAEPRIWFIDDDPSPRPPKCTVLWKELLRLRKHKSTANSLTPSSSSSSSSSSSLGDHVAAMEEGKKGLSSREKHVRRIKKGLERTKSAANIRLRPMVNVPICTATQGSKSTSLPPLIPLKKRQTA